MTRPDTKVVQAAQTASARMADRHTPFIFNAWYVAALGEELGEPLLARRLLGQRVVMYRASTGEPVALEDRCPHRSFPLSHGQRDGDTIVCGYHGLRFDTKGDCIEVPSQPTCPRNIGTRRYPLIERGPLVWIWMGDDEADADPALLPPVDWVSDAQWATSHGSLALPASYVRLHENLLDLTHLSFLHANSFGTPDYARAEYQTEMGDGVFGLQRDVVPTTLPPLWAKPTKLEGVSTAARIARSTFHSPALHEVNVRFYDSALPEGERPEYRIRTAHLPTPESATSTHYFVVHGRDFAQDDPGITDFMHEKLFAAFEEDVWGLGLQEEVLADADDGFYEISIAADGPSVAMRRYIKQRAEAEQQSKSESR
ncbi:aromatic ring-hydroxylating dioxygenase subunit alpha [Hydrogenophaga sp. 5NK40-0174]|uniref:aromatic ring-hydroxylating dioxygenase subunit alpha n=1 Tax=Hydrogenophaga sp. 5NK40-0174 TaxID=3127649 RepID=UPI0031049AF0